MKNEYKYHYNYIITCLINNKQYIGQHSSNNLDNSYYGSSKLLKQDIEQFGFTNFKKEIIEVCKTKRDAKWNERKYIKQYNTLIPNGYNISKTGGKFSPKTKKKKIYNKPYDVNYHIEIDPIIYVKDNFIDNQIDNQIYYNKYCMSSKYLIIDFKQWVKNEYDIDIK